MRNVIFDWSGTLVDDLPPVVEATNAVLRRYGLAAMDRARFRREFSLPFAAFYERLIPGVDLEELELVFRPAMAASTEPVTLIPQALAFLERCARARCRMFVLSAAPPEAVHAQAADLGLSHFFEVIYAGVRDKTHRISGILAEHQLHAAQAAGIRSIAVLTGYEFPEVIAESRPDITVADLSHLAALLEAGRAEVL